MMGPRGGGGPSAAPKPAVFETAAPVAPAPKPAARPSALASLMERETAAKKARVEAAPAAALPADDPPWVRPGIIVKVVAPSLKGGPFWKAKGAVVSVSGGGYVAEVEAPDPAAEGALAVLRVDQAHCETVLPAPGGRVLVVRGAAAGRAGKLTEIDEARVRARVELEGEGGSAAGWFEYEDICKRAGR